MQHKYIVVIENYYRPIALDRCSLIAVESQTAGDTEIRKFQLAASAPREKKTFADFRRVIPPLFIAAAALSEFLSRITGRGVNPPPPFPTCLRAES